MGAPSQNCFSFHGRFLEGSSMCSPWVVLAFCCLGQLYAGKRHLLTVFSLFLLFLSLYLFPFCFSYFCCLFVLSLVSTHCSVLGGKFRASNSYSSRRLCFHWRREHVCETLEIEIQVSPIRRLCLCPSEVM